jgi:hypothetical protein
MTCALTVLINQERVISKRLGIIPRMIAKDTTESLLLVVQLRITSHQFIMWRQINEAYEGTSQKSPRFQALSAVGTL